MQRVTKSIVKVSPNGIEEEIEWQITPPKSLAETVEGCEILLQNLRGNALEELLGTETGQNALIHSDMGLHALSLLCTPRGRQTLLHSSRHRPALLNTATGQNELLFGGQGEFQDMLLNSGVGRVFLWANHLRHGRASKCSFEETEREGLSHLCRDSNDDDEPISFATLRTKRMHEEREGAFEPFFDKSMSRLCAFLDQFDREMTKASRQQNDFVRKRRSLRPKFVGPDDLPQPTKDGPHVSNRRFSKYPPWWKGGIPSSNIWELS